MRFNHTMIKKITNKIGGKKESEPKNNKTKDRVARVSKKIRECISSMQNDGI